MLKRFRVGLGASGAGGDALGGGLDVGITPKSTRRGEVLGADTFTKETCEPANGVWISESFPVCPRAMEQPRFC